MPTFIDGSFTGINVAAPRESLPPGLLTELTNMIVVGAVDGQGGYLQSRPGKRATLTVPTGKAPYDRKVVIASDGSSWLLCVMGDATTARLYRWAKGAAGVSFLCANGAGLYSWLAAESGGYTAVAFNGPASQITQLGNFFFIVGAIDGNMRRVKNDWTVETASGLGTPLYTPVATATAGDFFPSPGQLAWGKYETGSLANLISSGNETPTAANTDALSGGSKYWGSEQTPVFGTFPDTGTDAVYLGGNPGASVTTRNPIVPTIGTDGEYPKVFRYAHYGRTKDVAGAITSRVRVTLTAYSDTACASPITGGQISYYIGLMGTETDLWECTFDLRSLGVDIRSLKLKVKVANDGITGDDPGLGNIVLQAAGYAFDVPVTASGANPSTLSAASGTVYASPPGGVCSGEAVEAQVVSLPQQTAFYTRNQRFFTSFAARDMSKVNRIAATVNVVYPVIGTVSLRTYIENAAGDREYSAVYDLEPNKSTPILFDITTAIPALRSAVTMFGVEFTEDILTGAYAGNFTTDPTSSPALLEISIVTLPGNLSVGFGSYEWRVTERNTAQTIESAASPISNSLTATDATAQGSLAITSVAGTPAVPQNTGAYMVVWRRGGVFTDGYFRRVAIVTTPLVDQSGDRWTWDYTGSGLGGVFLDSVPDSALLDVPLLLDHEPTPVNAIAVGVYANRIVLATTDALYISQLVAGVNAPGTGLYYNGLLVPSLPTAPNRALQGEYIPLAEAKAVGAGNVVRLVPYLSRLFVMFNSARFTLSGIDVDDFAFRRWESDEGRGLVSPFAYTVIDGQLVFLAIDGLRAMTGNRPDTKLSDPIAPRLSPSSFSFSGAALSATAYSRSALWVHSGRLYLSIPTATSGAQNGATWVLDDNSGGGWSLWDIPNITGGAVFSASTDTNDLYITDSGGQIYSQAGGVFGDTATLGGTVTGVPIAITSRGFAIGSSTATRHQGDRFSLAVSCAESCTMTLAVVADNDTTAAQWSKTYQFINESWVRRLRVYGMKTRGRILHHRITATTINPFILRRTELETISLSGNGRG